MIDPYNIIMIEMKSKVLGIERNQGTVMQMDL